MLTQVEPRCIFGTPHLSATHFKLGDYLRYNEYVIKYTSQFSRNEWGQLVGYNMLPKSKAENVGKLNAKNTQLYSKEIPREVIV